MRRWLFIVVPYSFLKGTILSETSCLEPSLTNLNHGLSQRKYQDPSNKRHLERLQSSNPCLRSKHICMYILYMFFSNYTKYAQYIYIYIHEHILGLQLTRCFNIFERGAKKPTTFSDFLKECFKLQPLVAHAESHKIKFSSALPPEI